MKWLFALIILTLAAPASAVPIVPVDPALGHLVVANDEAQVYVKTDAQSVIFLAVLPPDWTFSVLVDGNQDGVWGEGPVPSRDRRASPTSPDFSYGSSDGTLCSQYIYEAYTNEPDMVYGSSLCGLRKSAATFRTNDISNADPSRPLVLQTLAIPKAELRNGPRAVHFVIETWNGLAKFVFGSPLTPFVLTL